jgi:hypothetical protein
MSENGKGSTVRPLSVDQKTFSDNWERVFSTLQETCEYSGLSTPVTVEDIQREINELSKKLQDDPPAEYLQSIQSGMFWELYPHLSGQWKLDASEWRKYNVHR